MEGFSDGGSTPPASTIHSHVTWEITEKRLMVNLYWPSAAFVCDAQYRHKKQTFQIPVISKSPSRPASTGYIASNNLFPTFGIKRRLAGANNLFWLHFPHQAEVNPILPKRYLPSQLSPPPTPRASQQAHQTLVRYIALHH